MEENSEGIASDVGSKDCLHGFKLSDGTLPDMNTNLKTN